MLSGADTGAAAETYVAGRLQREGYRIVARNWRVRGGELDIVALDGATLVFVEVKARTGERVVIADETVTPTKLRRIYVAAEAFVDAHPEYEDTVWRVDLVAMTLRPDGSIQRYQHYQDLSLE